MKAISIPIAMCLLLAMLPPVDCRLAAQTQALQIDGPHEAKTGSLVRFSANTVEQETPLWIVLDPIEMDYEIAGDGQRLIFSAGCKTGQRITVLLLAQQVREGRIVSRQVRRTLWVVGDDGGDPDPDPPPRDRPPEGGPSFADSPLFLPVVEAWALIRTDAAKERSKDVADNIDTMALKCNSGAVRENSAIWAQLSKRNRETLGIESSAWEPVAKVMQIQFQDLSLPTPKDHGFHLQAVAAAIRAAANQKTNSRRPK